MTYKPKQENIIKLKAYKKKVKDGRQKDKRTN